MADLRLDTQRSRTPAGATIVQSGWPILAVVVLAVGFHFLGPAVGAFNARVLIDIGIAVTLAVSLNIVNGYTGQFSIGHAGFMGIGGYTAAFVTYYASFSLWGSPDVHGGWLGGGEWLFALGCILGGLAAAGAGYLVGLPTLRLRGDYLAIVTLGFGEIIRVLITQTKPVIYTAEDWKNATAAQLFPPPVGGAQGFDNVPKYTSLFWASLFAMITVLFAYRLKQSSTGRAMISIREDEIAAQAMGINATKIKVRAFVYAAFFAGIAGGLYAHESGVSVSPKEIGFQKSIDIVIIVVLGGMGSVSGVVLSAAVLTLLPELLRGFSDYRMIVYALVLIVMMILRPQGLFGVREIWDFLPRRRKTAGGKPA